MMSRFMKVEIESTTKAKVNYKEVAIQKQNLLNAYNDYQIAQNEDLK